MAKKDEMHDDDREPDQTLKTIRHTFEPAAPPVDIAAIVQAAVAAALKAGNDNGQAMADAITEGMKQVQQPIPENKVTDEASDANPLGDRVYPRSAIGKCEFYWGALDDQNKPHRAWEIDPSDATLYELLALNTLEPIEKTIRRLDRAPMNVSVVPKYNQTTGALTELWICIPLGIIGKRSHENKNMVPDLCELVRQINGHDLRPETVGDLDMLRWLYAEHKAKRFVSKRESVAA